MLKIIDRIDQSIVQSILHVYYFNKPMSVETKIVFPEPRSLLSILEEYHPGCQEYHLIKKLAKPTGTANMIFRDINHLGGKSWYTIKPEDFDKIYLCEWDSDIYAKYGNHNPYKTDCHGVIRDLIDAHLNIKKGKKLRYYDHMCLQFMIGSLKRQNKKFIQNQIKESISEYKNKCKKIDIQS